MAEYTYRTSIGMTVTLGIESDLVGLRLLLALIGLQWMNAGRDRLPDDHAKLMHIIEPSRSIE